MSHCRTGQKDVREARQRLEVAKAIGPRLAQAALGIKVDGQLRDL
jgi:hypothetical protein